MAAVLDRYQLSLPAPTVIASETQNEQYIATLLQLERQDHLTPEEKKYASLLAVLIEKYESEKYPIRSASPVEVLSELMEANNLRQKDLAPLLGSESIVSEVLSGRRELNKRHIQKLSQRFGVSPAVFF